MNRDEQSTASTVPWGVVDERKLAKIISFLQCRHDAFPVNDNINGTFQNDVPRNAFVALIENCKIVKEKNKQL